MGNGYWLLADGFVVEIGLTWFQNKDCIENGKLKIENDAKIGNYYLVDIQLYPASILISDF